MSERAETRPFVIGLTGPIAAGKSLVAAILARLGADVIDADAVYRELVSPPSTLLDAIVARFGESVLNPEGGLDRQALGKIVFADRTALADLEAITHPVIIAEIHERIARSAAEVVVHEAIKLIESGMAEDTDAVWYVDADPEVRLQRLMARNSMDEDTARARIATSRPALPSGFVLDEIIDNSGTPDETETAVTMAWNRLMRERRLQANRERTVRERVGKGPGLL